MAEPRATSRIARGLRTSLLVLAGLLVLAEVVVRLLGPGAEPPPLRFEFASRLDANLDGYENRFVSSESLFWELRPGALLAENDRVNAHGLRGPELVPDEDAFRIAVLGDSCTFGFEVGPDETYGAQLEGLLREAHPAASIQILNAGVPGYSVLQGLRRFEQDVVPLRPDAAVLYFGAWNDFNPAMGAGRSDLDLVEGEVVDSRAQVYGLLRHSRLFELIALRYAGTVRYRHWRSTVDAWLEGEPPHGYRVPLEDFQVLFGGFLDRCAELGLRAIVVLPELNETRRAVEPIHWPRLDAYREVMRAAAVEHGVAVIDQRELYADTAHAELFSDTVHPSAEGHRLLARALAAAIAEEDWLD